MNPARLLSSTPRSLLVAAFVVFAILAMRIMTASSPIMASDEYAYFATAKFESDEGVSVFQFDPGMQAVGNRVYPLLYRGWEMLGGQDAASIGRLFNSLLFVIGAFILFALFSRVFDRRSALGASALYLLMPVSFYAITLLPEVEFQLSVYLVVLVVMAAGPRPSATSIAGAAALSALSYFIKPHAAALIGATAAYLAATAWLQHGISRYRRIGLSAARGAGYLALTAMLVVLVNKLMPAAREAGDGVVASFYRSYVDRIFDADFIVANLAGFVDYVGGHLWLLLALFAPGVCYIAVTGGRQLVSCLGVAVGRPRTEEAAPSAYFALYVLLLLLVFLVMISVFTSTAGTLSEFEKYRLHGRYLGPVLPLLLGCSVWAIGQRQGRVAAAVGLGALATFVFFGRGMYKIFPWDYPDAFGLFSPSMRYWGFSGAVSWTVWAILLAGIVAYVIRIAGARPRAGYVGYLAFVVVAALASHVQMWRWVDFHVASNRQAVEAADAIESALGVAPPGSGLVLTLDRYGQAPYLLMGLDHPQYVRTTTKGAVITASELPSGVRWIVAPKAAQLVLPEASEYSFGDQQLHVIEPPKASE